MYIVTVTANPCIDKSATIAALLPEKKLRCKSPVLEPGGGGINVARAIRKLGGSATAVYLCGGYNGQLITQLLEEEHISALPVHIQDVTRENIIILDAAANLQYRFCMPGPQVKEKELRDCLAIINGIPQIDYLIASGSLAPGVPDSFYAILARHAKANNIKLVLDASGPAFIKALQEGVYMVKPNMGELCEYAGTSKLTITAAGDICREMIKAGKCQVALVSMGEAGALIVAENTLTHIIPPAVERKSTVGAGDSMTAGMVLSLAKGMDVLSAAKYAVACGTAATMNPGTQLCDVRDAAMLYARI